MSRADDLLGYVPYLRRFARALTGGQEQGDACVIAALEAMLAGERDHIPARLALYKACSPR